MASLDDQMIVGVNPKFSSRRKSSGDLSRYENEDGRESSNDQSLIAAAAEEVGSGIREHIAMDRNFENLMVAKNYNWGKIGDANHKAMGSTVPCP
jgi:hypothetical protein